MYSILVKKNPTKNVREFYWLILCIVNYLIWKTQYKMIIQQCHIPAGMVFKQIVCELRKQRTMDRQTKQKYPWTLMYMRSC